MLMAQVKLENMHNLISAFNNSGLRWLWLTLLCLVLDQVTKQLVVGSFNLYESLNILPFFNLTYVHNPGAAFSFLASQGGWQRWFFTVVAAIASLVFIIWLAKTPKITNHFKYRLCVNVKWRGRKSYR